MKIFGLGPAREIAEAVCRNLHLNLSPHVEEKFPDGELKLYTKDSVDRDDIIVFQSIAGDRDKTLNDRLCDLYFFLSHLQDKEAKHITAVVPYLAYARSDQRKNPEDPLTHRYVAQLLEASGVDKIICLDIHNIAAFENAFRCPVVNLEAAPLFCDYIQSRLWKNHSVVVMSPDIGGIKRAEKFRKILETKCRMKVDSGFLEKYRTTEGLEGHQLIGDVQGKDILIIDDMISTGATILHALESCQKNNCGKIKVFATHGVFSKNPEVLLHSGMIDEIVVTDSYPISAELRANKRLTVLPCSSLFTKILVPGSMYE